MKNKGYANFGGEGGGGGIRCIMGDVQVAYERVLHSFSVSISHIFNVLHSSTSACKTYYFASCVSNCCILHSVEFIIFSSSRIHEDKSFHCEVCNVCLDKRLEGNHKCRPDSGHDECCICLEVRLNKKKYTII